MLLKAVAALSLSLVGVAHAQDLLPGGYQYKSLWCSSIKPITGVSYGLVIQTQALAPQYSVRGGFFSRTGVYPGAVTSLIPMQLEAQDIYYAYFSFENTYQVSLNKIDFTAHIFKGNEISYICTQQN